MKLTARVKLVLTDDQRDLLLRTLEQANAACNAISQVAWETRTFGRTPLHRLSYYSIKAAFLLAAQVIVRASGKVVDAYKLDQKRLRTFHPRGAFPYDDRILNWRQATRTVSIWTLQGRIVVPYVTGDHHHALLTSQRGETDLLYRKGAFYLLATCEVEEPLPDAVAELLGVDLGVTNIAVTSDGDTFSGDPVERVRRRYARRRAKLQRVRTRAAKRRLKQIAQREANFRCNENHRISKRLVARAQDTGRGIALEELGGIRARLTVRKPQRARHSGWPFFQLRAFIEYKARLAGVSVVAVDPRNTSRTCPVCGCVDKRNRPAQAVFSCVACGFSGHADTVAAINIAVQGRHQTAHGSARSGG